VRGPRGGYRLAKERRRITVGEVVRIAESLEDGEESETATPRSDLGTRIVTPLIASLQDEVMARLDAISIEDLCARAREAGVDCGNANAADFTI
jgi:DNA-binding IscR family transcriptional regulator